ncbi:MAG: hypothetical protein ACP5OG_02950 [Candidatus Nanoarchaeia archaeon]
MKTQNTNARIQEMQEKIIDRMNQLENQLITPLALLKTSYSPNSFFRNELLASRLDLLSARLSKVKAFEDNQAIYGGYEE